MHGKSFTVKYRDTPYTFQQNGATQNLHSNRALCNHGNPLLISDLHVDENMSTVSSNKEIWGKKEQRGPDLFVVS